MGVNIAGYQLAMREGHRCAWALKWDDAVGHYRRAVDAAPDDVAAHSSLATALQRLGRLDEALAECRTILDLAPRDEAALLRLAEIQERRGIASDIADAFMRLGDHFLSIGLRDKAKQTWHKLAELLPEDLDAQERLYRVVARAGESTLAGRIGQTITRLRGEQDSRLLYSGPHSSASPPPDTEFAPSGGARDTEWLAAGMQRMLEARALEQGGSALEAFVAYARALACLRKAGAAEQITDLERSTQALAGRFGGLRLRDLATLGDAKLPSVVEDMLITQRQLSAGQVLGVIDGCLAGIARVPDFLPFQERLAEAQVRQGDQRGAASRYLSIAEVYAMRHDFEAASAAVAKAADLGHLSLESREGFIARLIDAGAPQAAKDQMLILADEFFESGAVPEAKRVLAQAAPLAPNDPMVLLQLGRALDATGDRTSAVGAYRRALECCPKDNEQLRLVAARRLSIAASRAGSFPEVEAALPILVDAIDEGRLGDAVLPDFSSAVQAAPDCLELAFCYGCLLAALQQPAQACVHLRRATTARAPIALPAHILLAQLTLSESPEMAADHLAAAESLLDDCETHDGHHEADLRRVAAELYVQRGDLPRGIAALNEVKRLVPRDKRVYPNLAELHFRLGDTTAALRELLLAGDLYREEGLHEQALGVYQGAAQLADQNAEAKGKLAAAYRSLGRIDEAMASMDELAVLLARQGESERAVDVLREMIDHWRQSDPAQALSLRQRIAELVPRSFEARLELVTAYLSNGQSDAALSEASQLWQDMFAASRWREATSALEQILQIDPWNVEALVHLGELAETTGETTEALERYQRALSIDPNNADVSNRLSRLAAGQHGKA